MTDIVITEFMDQAAVDWLAERYVVHYDPGLADHQPDVAGLLKGPRALIVRNRTQVRGILLESAKGLRVVGRLGVGLDNIDVDGCRARGIEVIPATGANDQSVAEYVITSAMVLLRGAWFSTPDVVAGSWPRQRLIKGREISGKRLGLIGLGAIARQVATRAQALGMWIGAFDPYVSPDDPIWQSVASLSLDAVLEESDVVSLHVPFTDETCNLIDAAALARMRPDAVLINAARGGVVDEDALVTALREKRLGGAALDVFAQEPLGEAGGVRFAGLEGLILTPHIAGVTVESNERVSRLIAERVHAILSM